MQNGLIAKSLLYTFTLSCPHVYFCSFGFTKEEYNTGRLRVAHFLLFTSFKLCMFKLKKVSPSKYVWLNCKVIVGL